MKNSFCGQFACCANGILLFFTEWLPMSLRTGILWRFERKVCLELVEMVRCRHECLISAYRQSAHPNLCISGGKNEICG
ncbi:hypothetical protein NMB0016 [Neisseria meningitidis MC58]|uniref:Uncharacterized protein n=1 Tax=Neisseria meningitidis serogroup B (strain ATCC BAA-335 / MC58) TaxID=122586 RepID=Q9K1Q4_NEIMB|nr:hypothetical protein NMB0016 [Neisseria meningitidis MC58]